MISYRDGRIHLYTGLSYMGTLSEDLILRNRYMKTACCLWNGEDFFILSSIFCELIMKYFQLSVHYVQTLFHVCLLILYSYLRLSLPNCFKFLCVIEDLFNLRLLLRQEGSPVC
jgi:hypothetical protein